MSNITLTPEALRQAERLSTEEPDYKGLPLRAYIDGKGCDGFYYGVSFAAAAEDDVRFVIGTITLVIDPESLRYMDGSSIDWIDDERGRGFLVENPQHRRFRGKFFKRKNWLETFTSSSQ